MKHMIQEKGAKINAFLSEDGQNRAVVDGVGRLKYSLDFAGRDNLMGAYNIESGNLRFHCRHLGAHRHDSD